ncbi:hypothetical protein K402DRAFT_220444 [Aulographum hederae CBS 113979]|uniref:Uncharacterized protein n=1 Tax=Aulographum hederae CBS 113979 TaxID=1176131 RepID=A0A6G1GM67_9PEZI|nr:hypothetical protein K402DRAFT_220444 [Aulographum hederae CBS 113979]
MVSSHGPQTSTMSVRHVLGFHQCQCAIFLVSFFTCFLFFLRISSAVRIGSCFSPDIILLQALIQELSHADTHIRSLFLLSIPRGGAP